MEEEEGGGRHLERVERGQVWWEWLGRMGGTCSILMLQKDQLTRWAKQRLKSRALPSSLVQAYAWTRDSNLLWIVKTESEMDVDFITEFEQGNIFY